mgnify:CR=1 FL=1
MKTSNKKYEITDIAHETYPFLHRIRALRDIGENVKAGDLGGFVEMYGKDRTIGFSNCERYFAKGTRGISGVLKIPALGPNSPNDFLTKLFAEYNAKAAAEVEQNAVDQAAYEAAMIEGTEIIAGITDADSANAAMPKYKAIKHALTSNKELGVIWNKKIEDCGLFFDKVLKRYTPVQKEQKGAE